MDRNESRNSEHINNTETNIDHHSDYYINLHICSMNIQGLKKFENDRVFMNYCKGFDPVVCRRHGKGISMILIILLTVIRILIP